MGLRKKKTQEQVFAPEAAPQDAYVSDVEARSRDLLESTEKTAREMADFYPTMLHPEDPEAMDRKVRGELDSLRRAATNIMRARQQLFGVRDELGARWNDVRPPRKKRRLRLNTPPNAVIDAQEAASNHFTKGVGLYKLLWVFYLGSFLGVVVDYLQLMTSAGGKGYSGENRQQAVSDISRMLKIMAKELQVPVLCLSQLSRANEKRDDKRPMLSDLRESGAIEQDADIVLFLYRDDYYNSDSEKRNVAECIVAKNRHGETGKVELRWMPEYTAFGTLENRYDDEE